MRTMQTGHMRNTADRPSPPAFSEALGYWFKLGCIGFGGPAGQIALMHAELVERRRWISERRFLHALNYCMLLPGPEAQQLAIYLGWLLHRTRGGVAAGVLFVLPSLLLLIALSWAYLAWSDVAAVRGVTDGLKPAVVAIVLVAALRIGRRVLRGAWPWAVAILAFVAIFLLAIPFPWIIFGAAAIGLVVSHWRPAAFSQGTAHASASSSYGAAVIDDDTPLPVHAHFRWRRLALVLLVCIALWLLAMFAVPDPLLRQMALFFSKLALLTFGGAYAVLPYVNDVAVSAGWLSQPQMIDGLALGETTPGPLIMVVAFVGFVGAWNGAVFGSDALALAGIAGAVVATFFTFLPSFAFVLVGAPLIEKTQHDVRFTAPLAAINAAVVGVIANLGVVFAQHVFRPDGALDIEAVIIAALAALVLYRQWLGVVPTLLACAAYGALRAVL